MSTNEWQPHALCRCMDSPWAAYATVALCLGVILWYHWIAFIWYRSARRSAPEARAVWYLLLVIFAFCAWAGYGATVLALGLPKVAIPFRIACLVVVNLMCPAFIWVSRRFRFHEFGGQQAAGKMLLSKPIEGMSDRDVVALARAAISEGLARAEERLAP